MMVTLKVSPTAALCDSGLTEKTMSLWAFDLGMLMKKKGTTIRINSRGLKSRLSCLRFNTLKQEEGRQTFKFIDIASKRHSYIICL
jgi:hypothetical protein